ncbi:MAG: STAS domain-containing protein [Thermoguttaceae bacterium]
MVLAHPNRPSSGFFRRIFPPKTVLEDIRCSQCGKPLWFTVKRLDEATVLTFLPEKTIRSRAGRFEELVSAVGDVQRVVVDLSHFDVIPSFLLGTLITLYSRLTKAGGKLKLCCVPRFWQR